MWRVGVLAVAAASCTHPPPTENVSALDVSMQPRGLRVERSNVTFSGWALSDVVDRPQHWLRFAVSLWSQVSVHARSNKRDAAVSLRTLTLDDDWCEPDTTAEPLGA